jgi:Uma2 family endonuclease
MNTALKLATYEDVLRAPPHQVAELIHGVLYTQPRPAPRHSLAIAGITQVLRSPFDRGNGGPGGWVILLEPELHLSGDVLVPDLAAWRRERMPKLPGTAFIELAPDWICEVLSPGNAHFDRGIKMPRYAAAGVTFAWLLDPIEKTLEVFKLTSTRPAKWVLQNTFSGADPIYPEPFDALPFELDVLWEI